MFRMLEKKRNQKGFTLIELIVVIGIIGILVAIALPRFQNSQATSRGTKIIADLRTIDSAIVQAQAAGIAKPAKADLTGSYIAVWPKPPEGNAVFPKTAANMEVKADAEYTIDATKLRALLGTKTVDDFVNP